MKTSWLVRASLLLASLAPVAALAMAPPKPTIVPGIPEPTSAVVFAAGALLVGFAVRRRARR